MIRSPDHLQRLAADPEACVWVTASAGTGKTKVLTDRVLNLLLDGAEPQRILCLTFTRAAAGEMQNRLHQRLSEWVVLDPQQLIEKITAFLGTTPTPEQLLRARTLFPIVLDSPGGMKIQTIHGFCQSILKRFPLEADLTPNFQVLDETLADHLLQKVQDDLLRSNKDLRPFLAKLTDTFDDGSFSEMLAYLMGERHKWSWLLHESHTLARAKIEIERLLKVSLDDTVEGYIAQAFNENRFRKDDLAHAAQCLQKGSETDQKRGQTLLELLNRMQIDDYISLFLTTEGEVRKRLATKKVVDDNPDVLEILIREAEGMQELHNRIRSLNCGLRTWAIINLGIVILKRYSEEKQRRGQLDYNDLIEHTARLLRLPDVAPWVLFKLDGGLDHILVDEAQDTNLHQWTVISSLAEEFFSGKGARDHKRTLFVVGDLKQSIYSFQGANPYVFDGMRKHFTKAIQQAQANWREVQLNISFRSTQAVLQVVDKVFEQVTARDGVALEEELIEHHSFRKGQGGTVEVWPLVRQEETEELSPWSPPVTVESQDIAPQVRLAQVMAAQMKQWLDSKELLLSRGRPIRSGDIMVLVRRRSSFVEDLVRALKQAGVPVAGADRMDLLAHLAVQDLIAIGRFVIQPLDDLNLACVLKGPLVNVSEEELFTLAHDRGEQSLWQRLVAAESHVCNYLQAIRHLAQTMTPFDFYSSLLGARGGRKALIARLGYEASDPIEEFLNVVQQYQLSNVPSLLGFLTWMAQGDLEVKRDLEQGEQNEVRIMTVHGSKGLQAPIVFMPDTVQLPRNSDRILWASCGEHAKLPVWSPPSREGCTVTDMLKQASQNQIDQEYRRLMYVAMTRAEDRLYVCGWLNQHDPVDGSWYKMIEAGVKDIGQAIEYDFSSKSTYGWQGTGWRYTCPQLVELDSSMREDVTETAIERPDWLMVKPTGEQPSTRPTRPSKSEDVTFKPAVHDRGTVIHKLLQYLPEVPAEQRAQAGLQLLKTMPLVPEDKRASMVQDVLRVLNDEKLGHIFSEAGRAEVPITGTINGKTTSGQVDRLLVIDHEIIIVDYKTHRVPPANIQEVPTIYLHQLATYKEILQRIYPHHTIRCILLWTQTLDIMEIPQYMLTNYPMN
jgi:ATP-dependent helicase/nuclease subunit A